MLLSFFLEFWYTKEREEKKKGVIGDVDEDNVSRLKSAVLLRGSTGSTESVFLHKPCDAWRGVGWVV